jgi:hypothetical protein
MLRPEVGALPAIDGPQAMILCPATSDQANIEAPHGRRRRSEPSVTGAVFLALGRAAMRRLHGWCGRRWRHRRTLTCECWRAAPETRRPPTIQKVVGGKSFDAP